MDAEQMVSRFTRACNIRGLTQRGGAGPSALKRRPPAPASLP